jgi:hypothetical protein
MSGSVRPDQFFDPANIERLLARLDDGGEQRVSE